MMLYKYKQYNKIIDLYSMMTKSNISLNEK